LKKVHRLHRFTQRGWHPQPIIAEGIRKYRREKLWNENKVLQYSNTDYKKYKKNLRNLCNLWTSFFHFHLVKKVDRRSSIVPFHVSILPQNLQIYMHRAWVQGDPIPYPGLFF
jgi:hypothetical protein